MEFFEFDNSFIGGYGELTTSLGTGDKHVSVTGSNGKKYGTNCNQVQGWKTAQSEMGYKPGDGTICIDKMPYAVKSEKDKNVKNGVSFGKGGTMKF